MYGTVACHVLLAMCNPKYIMLEPATLWETASEQLGGVSPTWGCLSMWPWVRHVVIKWIPAANDTSLHRHGVYGN